MRLGAPRYKPEVHGPPAGMNIAQAFKQLGRIEEARAVVRRMQAMGWAPLAASLATLDADIMAAATPKQDDAAPEVGAVVFDSPIWTRFLWEPDWLWREPAADEPVITLPTFANEMVSASGMRKSDDLGRLTRVLPLYLEEVLQVRFRVRARASMWVAKNHGPAVVGRQPDRETLESAAPPSTSRRIIVAGSLVASGVALRLWEIGSPDEPTNVPVAVALNDPAAVVAAVERALLGALIQRGLLIEAPLPHFYRPPAPAVFGAYVSCLEQLFYQLIAANQLVPPESLWNERGFFESYIGLVEGWPSAPESARMIRDRRNRGGGDVPVGAGRALPEDRGPLGRRGRARQRHSSPGARDLQAPRRGGSLPAMDAARAGARRRALHGLAGSREDGRLSAASRRARPRARLLGELERAVLAVDLEREVLDLGRARRRVVDLGADLDARQPHVRGEAAVVAT